MTEEMAIESLVKLFWELKGYLVKTRVHYKGKKGGIRDIDVLCFDPKTRECIVIECKAWGSPEEYPTYTLDKKNKKDIIDSIKELTNELALRRAKEVLGVDKVDRAILYVGGDVDQHLIDFLNQDSKIPIDVVPIHKLVFELFLEVASDMRERRKRYPDTALELIRWFDRCLVNEKINLSKLEAEIKKKWGPN